MIVEIFKAGTHTDGAGQTWTYTAKDIEDIAAKYNEQDEHEAPIVIGHPKTDAPAYGWVTKLKADGDKLVAEIGQYDEEFKELYEAGRYKKVSVALYPNKLLRHVGFLGAQPPAVKGLKQAEFKESEYALFEYADTLETLKEEIAEKEKTYGIKSKELIDKPEVYSKIPEEYFADPVNWRFPLDTVENFKASWRMYNMNYYYGDGYSDVEKQIILARFYEAAAGFNLNIDKPQLGELYKDKNKFIKYEEGFKMNPILEKFFAWAAEQFGPEAAQQMQEKYLAIEAEEKAAQQQVQAMAAPAPAQATATPLQLSYAEKFKEQELKIKNLETVNRMHEFNEYLKSNIEEGRLLPAQREIALAALEATHELPKMEFAESTVQGNGIVKKLIESYPVLVEFGEKARADKTDNTRNYTEIDEDVNYQLDNDRLALDNKAQAKIREFADQGKTLTYVQALQLVMNK